MKPHESKLVDVIGDKIARATAHGRVAYRRRIEVRQVTFTCQNCTQEVTQYRYPGPKPRYCGDECEAEANRKKTRARVRRHRQKRRAGEGGANNVRAN